MRVRVELGIYPLIRFHAAAAKLWALATLRSERPRNNIRSSLTSSRLSAFSWLSVALQIPASVSFTAAAGGAVTGAMVVFAIAGGVAVFIGPESADTSPEAVPSPPGASRSRACSRARHWAA